MAQTRVNRGITKDNYYHSLNTLTLDQLPRQSLSQTLPGPPGSIFYDDESRQIYFSNGQAWSQISNGGSETCLSNATDTTQVCVEGSDTVIITTAGIEAARVNSSQQVLIGTTTPSAGELLNVAGDVDVLGNLDGITPAERTQLRNIDTTVINATQWGRVGTMQDVASTASPTFSGLSVSGDIGVTGNLDGITPAERSQLRNIDTTVINTTQWGRVGTMQDVASTASPTFTGLSVSGGAITDVSDPTAATDAATKNYVDTMSPPGSLSGLTDTTITAPAINQILGYNGVDWINTLNGSPDANLNMIFGRSIPGGLTGSDNMIFGDGAADSITTQSGSVIIGVNAGQNINSRMVAVGQQAGQNCTVQEGTFIGSEAGNAVAAARACTFIGHRAGFGGTISNNWNVGIGSFALGIATKTGVGCQANIAVGHAALGGLTTGTANFGLGFGAGGTITTESGNICIGGGFGTSADITATDTGCFVVSGSNAQTVSWGPDTGAIRTHGGFRIYTAAGTATGVEVSSGGTAWAAISDSRRKENFTEIDVQLICDLIEELPLSQWNYKAEDTAPYLNALTQAQNALAEFDPQLYETPEEAAQQNAMLQQMITVKQNAYDDLVAANTIRQQKKHCGPMAQDWYKSFGGDHYDPLKIEDRHQIDILLCTIKALIERVDALETQVGIVRTKKNLPVDTVTAREAIVTAAEASPII